MFYPASCFSINETRTAANRRAYEKWLNTIEAECLKRCPNYLKMTLRDRYNLRKEIEKDFPCPV